MHGGIKQKAKIVDDLKLKPKNFVYWPREEKVYLKHVLEI